MTLVPSILYIICMIRPIMSAQIIGIIGVLKFYQEAYGTLVYFVSYMYNKRYEGTNLFVSFSFVLLANGIWYVYMYIQYMLYCYVLKLHVFCIVYSIFYRRYII